MKYLVAAVIFLCIAACKKKDTSTPIDATLKKYFSYKKGTYWIYRDSLRGVIDCFAVLSNDFHTISTNN
jgi:hypothetical protein